MLTPKKAFIEYNSTIPETIKERAAWQIWKVSELSYLHSHKESIAMVCAPVITQPFMKNKSHGLCQSQTFCWDIKITAPPLTSVYIGPGSSRVHLGSSCLACCLSRLAETAWSNSDYSMSLMVVVFIPYSCGGGLNMTKEFIRDGLPWQYRSQFLLKGLLGDSSVLMVARNQSPFQPISFPALDRFDQSFLGMIKWAINDKDWHKTQHWHL